MLSISVSGTIVLAATVARVQQMPERQTLYECCGLLALKA